MFVVDLVLVMVPFLRHVVKAVDTILAGVIHDKIKIHDDAIPVHLVVIAAFVHHPQRHNGIPVKCAGLAQNVPMKCLIRPVGAIPGLTHGTVEGIIAIKIVTIGKVKIESKIRITTITRMTGAITILVLILVIKEIIIRISIFIFVAVKNRK